jgi:uncharacterized surface protein with fasciclin (FAS1) repeats
MANIIETAKAAGCFATLLTAVEVAGLTAALESPGPFTVFAPVDDAFAALPPGTVQTLVDNPPQLARILKYHVLAGAYTREALVAQAEKGGRIGEVLVGMKAASEEQVARALAARRSARRGKFSRQFRRLL